MADDPLDPPENTDAEVELDIRAFLPEDTDLVGDWGDGAPEPEVPAWARDDAVADAEVNAEVGAEVDAVADAGLGTDPEPAPAPESVERIDLTVLEGIEADLIEVDEAIAALDAGDVARSPLLQRLTPRP